MSQCLSKANVSGGDGPRDANIKIGSCARILTTDFNDTSRGQDERAGDSGLALADVGATGTLRRHSR